MPGLADVVVDHAHPAGGPQRGVVARRDHPLPAVEVDGAVGQVLVVAARGPRLVVHHGLAVEDAEVAVPSLPEPVAQVDVLHAVGEDRVEAAQGHRVGVAQRERGPRERVEPQPLDAVRVLGREAPEERVRQPAARGERDAGRLDRPARVEQQRLGAEHVVVGQGLAERCEPAGRDLVSLLRNTTTSPVACASARLLPSAKPWFSGLWWTCTRSARQPVEGRGDLGRGAVVPDDDLDVALRRQQRLDAGRGQLAVVVRRHDHRREPRRRRPGLQGGPVDEVPVEHDAAPVAGRGPERPPAVREAAAYADARHQLDLGVVAHQEVEQPGGG